MATRFQTPISALRAPRAPGQLSRHRGSRVNDPVKRKLCIAIHDVSPATWPHCERLLKLLRTLGRLPVTLAVVPDFHGKARVDRAPWFAHAVDAHVAQGAEVALHGYRHLDESR